MGNIVNFTIKKGRKCQSKKILVKLGVMLFNIHYYIDR